VTDLENMRSIFRMANIEVREYANKFDRLLQGQEVTVLEARVQQYDMGQEQPIWGVAKVRVLHVFDKEGKLLHVWSKNLMRKAPHLAVDET
jgi:hypothetical protein